jgi:two-component system sensor histidine kinase HydH
MSTESGPRSATAPEATPADEDLPSTAHAAAQPAHAWLRQRPFLHAIHGLASGPLLYGAGLAGPRLLAHLGLLAALVVHAAVVARRARREGVVPAIRASLVVFAGLLLGDIAVTGGLASPVLPALLGLAARPAALGWTRSTRITAGLVVAAPLLFALGAPWLAVAYHGHAWTLVFIANVWLATRYLARTLVVVSASLDETRRTLSTVQRDGVEGAVRRSRDLEGICANVARELRVPLTSIKDRLDQQRSSGPDARSAQCLDTMMQQLARIDGVLSDYLSPGHVTAALGRAPEAPAGPGATVQAGSRLGRRAIVLAHAATTTLLLAAAGLPLARLVALGVLALVTAARTRRDPLRTAVADFATVAGAVALTGGLASPFILGLVAAPVGFLALFGGARPAAPSYPARLSRLSRSFRGAELATLLLYGLLPAPILAVAYARPALVMAAQAVTLLVMVLYLGHVAATLSAGLGAALRGLERERAAAMRVAASRTRDLEAVAAKVGHEIKNPLAAVKSLLQLEQSRERAPEARQNLEAASREVARVQAILDDYLTFSRPFDGLSWTSVDLGALGREVISSLAARARAGAVRLRLTGGCRRLMADARRLKEAVFQLVCNALDATPAGGEVALRLQDTETGVRLLVHDNGSGMSAAVLERLGTPFFTTREAGTGLGVVVARLVIQQHGGTLRFSSRLGRGTTAEIAIPSTSLTEGAERVEGPTG